MNEIKISGGQAVCLLLLSRLFSLSGYSPALGESATGLVLLWGVLLSIGLQVLLAVPLFLFARYSPGRNPVVLSRQQGPRLGSLVGILYGVSIFAQLLASLITFVEFMVTAIYPNASAWILLLWMCPCIFVCAGYGLEAMGRASTIAAFFLLLGIALITIILPSEGSLSFIDPIGQNAVNEVVHYAVDFTARTPELYLLLLLYPSSTKKPGRILPFFWGLILVIAELCFFLVISVMGQRGLETVFPFFSLSAVASLPFLQRTDSFHMIFWVILALFRCGLLLRLCADCLLPATRKNPYRILMAVLLLAGAVVAGLVHDQHAVLRAIHLFSIPAVVLLTGLLPLLLLTLLRKERSHGKKGSTASAPPLRS